MPLKGTVWRAFPLIALIALGAFFYSTPGSAHYGQGRGFKISLGVAELSLRVRFSKTWASAEPVQHCLAPVVCEQTLCHHTTPEKMRESERKSQNLAVKVQIVL